MTKKPTSFLIFLAVSTNTALVILTSILFSVYHVDKKYAMVLAFFMFVAFAFTTVGVYSGIKYKPTETRDRIQNRIGLIGNTLVFLFTVVIMSFAALTKAS